MIDCVYVAAAAHDARFTRICVASIRYFYPDIPIRLLAGGPLQRRLVDELERYWRVTLADLPPRDYGWGFIKLEPLFQQGRQRFLVLDSDTVLAGPVLDWAEQRDEDFIIDDEQDELQTTQRTKEIYYDYERAQAEGAFVERPSFLFNTGQWFGSSGILSREDFKGIVEWVPPRVCKPSIFKMGEQGAFNYIINEQWRAGKIRVARVPLMRWPGHGMQGLNINVVTRRTAAPIVVHWAGTKENRLQDMVGADLLLFFEQMYYARLPLGATRRLSSNFQRYARPKLGLLKSITKLAVARFRG
jgi:hypothetical protein